MATPEKTAPVKHKLLELLPKILPKSSNDAITGTDLIAKVRGSGLKVGTDNSLRAWFSGFAKDPTSPIAKVAKGNGYYLRGVTDGSKIELDGEPSPEEFARDKQLEEKFRALFMKWCESQGEAPVLLNHNEGAKKAAGLNKWKYPDVVSVRWDVLDDGDGEAFDENALDVMRGLGEAPFELISSELKVEIKSPNLRQSFFQCVSNSKWAHVAQLVVAYEISDESVAAELERLGSSYDLTILSFGVSEEYLKSLPAADKIRAMTSEQADDVLSKLSVKTFATGKSDEGLDWNQLRDLQKQHATIGLILEWISRCLEDKQPHSYEMWKKNLRKKSHSH